MYSLTVQPSLAALLQAPLVQQLHQRSSVSQLSPAPAIPPTTVATIEQYYQGLGKAALIQQHAVTNKTHKARLTAFREYNNWLLLHVQIRDVNTCTPEDFLVYFTQHWVGDALWDLLWREDSSHLCQLPHLQSQQRDGWPGPGGTLGLRKRSVFDLAVPPLPLLSSCSQLHHEIICP